MEITFPIGNNISNPVADPGGGRAPPTPLFHGVDFYSGFRNAQTFSRGCVQIDILKTQVKTCIVTSGKIVKGGGGGANRTQEKCSRGCNLKS